MFAPNSRTTAIIDALVDALMTLSQGQTISYAALSRAAGKPLAGGAYEMRRAIRLAEQNTGAVFDTVRGHGYQRLVTADIPAIAKRANSRIRRHAKSTRIRLDGVRANDMTAKEVAVIAAYRSHFGMIEGLARDQTIKAAEAAITATFVAPQTLANRMAGMVKK